MAKSAKFDFVIDENMSQKKIYETIGIGDMVKNVIEVLTSFFNSLHFKYRAIMLQCLLMDRQGLERHLVWKDISINSMTKECPSLK
jgi:uncharacterized protein with HEPN domain